MKKLYSFIFPVLLFCTAIIGNAQSTTIYYENFDANNGGWTSSVASGRNGSWQWTNGTTPIVGEGNYWRIQPFNVYSANMLTYVTSPAINTTGFNNVSFAIDIRYDTDSDRDDGARIEYTFDPLGLIGWTQLGSQGAPNTINWYNDNDIDGIENNAHGWSGKNFENNNSVSKFLQAVISDPLVLNNQTAIRFRVVFGSDGGTADLGVAIDNVILKGDSIVPLLDPLNAPAAVNNGLKLWLKANAGIAATDGTAVSLWQDQAFDNHAVGITTTRPVFRNSATRNINFNPVVDFTKAARHNMKGKGGFWSNDYYLAVRVNNSFSAATNPGQYFFGGKFSTNAFGVDGTGASIGRGSARYTDAVIAHTISSFPNGATSGPNATSYGRAFQSATASLDQVMILNIKSNTTVNPAISEIYLNGKRIDNANGIAGNGMDLTHLDFQNLVYYLGVSPNTINGSGFNGFLDGRLAEIFTYSSPRTAVQQQRILSYLSIKYGTTLQSPGSSLAFNRGDLNLLDSQGTPIWNTGSAGGNFNWDIAGIGRDDASQLNQKQSKSQNNGANVPVLTMGLGDVAATNSANPNTFPTNRSFLVWGSNGQNMNNSGVPITLSFGPMTVNTVTDVANRKWQVVETGGNVPTVKVQVPTAALTNFTPLVGNDAYVMVVADDQNFTNGIETVFLTTNGANQEAFFDFDGTKFITFGVAHETVAPRHLTFDGNDDFVRMDNAPNLGNSFTVMAWIRNTGNNSPATDQALFAKSNGSTGYTLFYRTNNRLRMEWTGASGNNTISGNTQIPPNEWHHITVVYSGGTARMYIDGVEDVVQGSLSAPANTTHNFSIGAQFRSQTDIRNNFNGEIDELRMWTRALTPQQIRFVMNQEILQNGTSTRGVVIPNTIPLNDIAPVNWADLNAYYTMNSFIGTHINDDSQNNQRGRLIVPNLIAINEQNAPLPYVSASNGAWSSNATWRNGGIMDIPYDISIVDGSTPIAWNIVRTAHNISSVGNKVVLGLMVDNNTLTANNNSKLEVSHYLKIDGKIDLEGQSQLLQTFNSFLDATSSGVLERDQQGTNVIYNYNYWSSPVGISNNTTNNNNYSISTVVRDGNNPASPVNFNFTTGFDGIPGSPATLSTRWMYRFDNAGNNINNWIAIGSTGTVQAGKGYIHKGTGSGLGYQNYTFRGKPHNGRIQHSISGNMLTLVGNPYASALNASTFINDNLSATDGSLYFWEHWGGGTHRLLDYQGGYAVRNLSGGVPAISHPDVNQTGSGTKTPGQFVPVGQGFFVIADPDGGNLVFDNNQRAFVRETDPNSNPIVKANKLNKGLATFPKHFSDNSQDEIVPDGIQRIRLRFTTVDGFKRQILLAFTDNKATDDFDKGYDGQNLDNQPGDMYFVLNDKLLSIQGVGKFDENKSYPLGIRSAAFGKAKIALDSTENFSKKFPVYLFDKETGLYHDLSQAPFEFDIEAIGETNDRFSLFFRDQNTLSTDEFEIAEGLFKVYHTPEDNVLHIINQKPDFTINRVQLYDLLGKTVWMENVESANSNLQINLPKLSKGVYLVKMNGENGQTITKKMILE